MQRQRLIPSLLLCILLTMAVQFSFAQNRRIDSLQALLKSLTTTDTLKLKVINSLSSEYQGTGEFDKTLQHANEVLSLAKEMSPSPGLLRQKAQAYNSISITHAMKGDFAKALEVQTTSFQLLEEIGDQQGMALSYNNMANMYNHKGDYAKAMEHHFKSLKIREAILLRYPGNAANKKGMALSYSNLGITYHSKGDYAKALEFHVKSLKMREATNDKLGMATSFNNIGIIYKDKSNFSKALEYQLKSMKLFEELGNKYGLGNSYNNIGNIYESKGQSTEALDYQLKSLEIRKETEDKLGITQSYYNLGVHYLKAGKPAESNAYMAKSLALANEIHAMAEVMNAYGGLSKSDSARGNYKEAFLHHKSFTAIKDSLFNEEAGKKEVQSEMNFEFAKKEQVAKLEQEKKDAIAAGVLEQQTLQRNGFIGGFALMLALAAVSFRSYRNKRKAHASIEAQKAIVDAKNKDILDSILYAKRIQDALLKEEEQVAAHLPEQFILFKPKDIVSGDFFWSLEKQGHLYLTAVDCTGHGVPGAFMSMLGIAFLNEITAGEQLQTPAEILDHLREKIIEELSQSGEDGENKDGMDISLIRIQLDTKELQWAGANNPLWIIDHATKKITELKPDKQPIGFYYQQQAYTNHSFTLNSKDSIYLFTDGYADQFGGEKGKKFKYSRLKEQLLSMQDKSMQEQKEILNNTFETWKGTLDQVDDVCVIGVAI